MHFDALYEGYLNACLIMLGIGVPFDPGLPFMNGTSRQDGFGVFGGPHVLSLVTEVATRALKCIWRQKWMVHRRARPEAVAGLVECHRMKPTGPVPLVFVAYGVGVIFVAGVVNAVKNVPQIYIDNARMLGASHWRVYTTVILPSIFPELRATILLSLGIGWAAVLGAEYLGAQSGLGYIIIYSEQFAYLDRMFLVALIFILYASVSYWLFAKLSARMLQWMPRAGRMTALG